MLDVGIEDRKQDRSLAWYHTDTLYCREGQGKGPEYLYGNVDTDRFILVVLCEDSGGRSEGPDHSSTCIQSEMIGTFRKRRVASLSLNILPSSAPAGVCVSSPSSLPGTRQPDMRSMISMRSMMSMRSMSIDWLTLGDHLSMLDDLLDARISRAVNTTSANKYYQCLSESLGQNICTSGIVELWNQIKHMYSCHNWRYLWWFIIISMYSPPPDPVLADHDDRAVVRPLPPPLHHVHQLHQRVGWGGHLCMLVVIMGRIKVFFHVTFISIFISKNCFQNFEVKFWTQEG